MVGDSRCGEFDALSAEQLKAIAAVINPLTPAVSQLCDRVLAIPGVAEVFEAKCRFDGARDLNFAKIREVGKPGSV